MQTAFALVIGLCTAGLLLAAEIPPGEPDAKDRLNTSPRHGEWVDIPAAEGAAPLRSYIVYPERREPAPLVIVIHEIYGLTDWIRAVADQLAADGFIAIAPDLLSGMGPDGGGTESVTSRDDVTRLVRELTADQVMVGLDAVRAYGLALPAANTGSAVVGFCWGGTMSFRYATHQPELKAAVVYYGTAPGLPGEEMLAHTHCSVLGLYGEDDARVTSTVAPTEGLMKKLGKKYEVHIYNGAGHGFLRGQSQRDGANLHAAQQAWRATLEFLRKHTQP